MRNMPEAVTIDFHNTIARCDQWFQLEVHQLLPAFLSWHAQQNGATGVPISFRQAQVAYRRIRRDVMLHGFEIDAVSCVEKVTNELGYPLDRQHIEHGVGELMRAALEDCTPVDGIIGGIRQLREQNVRLAVISSAVYHPFLEWSLDRFGVRDEFDAVITSASSGFYKSRTEIYRMALGHLDTTPACSVHVGDSFRFDVDTAARIGMGTVLYDPDGSTISTDGAGAVVTSLSDIATVVQHVHRERHS